MRKLLMGAVTAAAVLLAGCSGHSDDESAKDGSATPAAGASRASATFGTLKDVCGPGTAKAAKAQGVTDTSIQVGVMSDIGFTKNSEFPDAAKVFTSWCNDAGGVEGRKLVPVTHDTKLLQAREGVLAACKTDFALVGGGSALDGLGVTDRLKCLLPDFPAQSTQAVGSDLQVLATGAGVGYFPYAGFYSWLLKDKYPDSAGKVGIIAGDSPVSKVFADQYKEAVGGLGGKVTYNDLYPAAGVSDWTPYAQSIKSKGRWDPDADRFRVARVSANTWRWARTADGWRVVERVNANLDGTAAHRELLAPAADPASASASDSDPDPDSDPGTDPGSDSNPGPFPLPVPGSKEAK